MLKMTQIEQTLFLTPLDEIG